MGSGALNCLMRRRRNGKAAEYKLHSAMSWQSVVGSLSCIFGVVWEGKVEEMNKTGSRERL